MVNTGKPSRGCYMCRARRIKCDEAKPHCMRCQKSKRICPGYRDAFELKLRDESQSTKKKLSRRLSQDQSNPSENLERPRHASFNNSSFPFPATALVPSSRGHSRSSSLSSVSSHGTLDPTLPSRPLKEHSVIAGQMPTPIHQQAACYFLSNFVLVPEAGTMRGYLDFVIPLMKNPHPAPSLLLAFSAVALAALGTRPNSKSLIPKADMWYLKALKEINAALQNPKIAGSDSTLAAVMLMASFEQLVPSRMKPAGWGSHVDGAVAVIKSRPLSAWKTPIEKDMFIAVRAHMTINCIANSKAVDPTVDWLAVKAPDPIVQSFAVVNLKMASLRAETDKTTTLPDHSAQNIEKVLNLLKKAEAIDQEYIAWINSLPPAWDIRTVAWIDGDIPDLANSIVHPGRIDAYAELWQAYKYNIVRACRLFIWSSILRCTAWLVNPKDYRSTPEYVTATRVCTGLVDDIVASVPYFFGWNRDKDGPMADPSNFACGTNDDMNPKPLGGLFVMWPLFAAAASDFATPSQRTFLRGRLKHIAEIMGINQALILFQIPLVHPSFYIARERMSLPPTVCHSDDMQVSIVSGNASAAAVVKEAKTLPGKMSNWGAQEPTWTVNASVQDRPWTTSPPARETERDREMDRAWPRSVSPEREERGAWSASPSSISQVPSGPNIWKPSPSPSAFVSPMASFSQSLTGPSTSPRNFTEASAQFSNAVFTSEQQIALPLAGFDDLPASETVWDSQSPPEQMWQTTPSPPHFTKSQEEQAWSSPETILDTWSMPSDSEVLDPTQNWIPRSFADPYHFNFGDVSPPRGGGVIVGEDQGTSNHTRKYSGFGKVEFAN